MDLNGKKEVDFTVPLTPSTTATVKILVPAIRSQGLNLLPWASTYVLAGLLHKLDIQPPPSDGSEVPILELGAGIGLVGLVASMLWNQRAVLTDLADIVPGLTANIEANAVLLKQHRGSASAGALDWNEPDRLVLDGGRVLEAGSSKANVIIAADTIYDEDHPKMLVGTISRWLARGPQARLVITYPLRVAYLEQIRELWELLEGWGRVAFGVGKEEAEEIGGASWDDEKLCEWSIWKWKDSEVKMEG